MTIRAPIAGTILQMNAKIGELASPSAPQPLLLLADVSALRVRAEVDERDIERIKIGQSVFVRPVAFRKQEFVGTVSFIARHVKLPDIYVGSAMRPMWVWWRSWLIWPSLDRFRLV